MQISGEELKGKVGEGVQNFFDTLYEKPILLFFVHFAYPYLD